MFKIENFFKIIFKALESLKNGFSITYASTTKNALQRLANALKKGLTMTFDIHHQTCLFCSCFLCYNLLTVFEKTPMNRIFQVVIQRCLENMLVISAQTKVGKKNNIVTIQNLPTNFTTFYLSTLQIYKKYLKKRNFINKKFMFMIKNNLLQIN